MEWMIWLIAPSGIEITAAQLTAEAGFEATDAQRTPIWGHAGLFPKMIMNHIKFAAASLRYANAAAVSTERCHDGSLQRHVIRVDEDVEPFVSADIVDRPDGLQLGR